MSLDKFTLQFTPSPDDPNVIDLVDPSGVVHYRERRVQGATYEIHVCDPISGSTLISGTAPNPASRHKTLELFNPSITVVLKNIGKVSFRWAFKWEDHRFQWKRDKCYMIRKPDPPLLVAIASEPPSRIRNGSVQILDCNLNRFDIEDRKGLEIVLLTALFTFSDLNEGSNNTPTEGRPSQPRRASTGAPPADPRPEPRAAVGRTTQIWGEANELVVEEGGDIEDYVGYGLYLLKDEEMIFITLHPATEDQVPKTMRVAEEITRLRRETNVGEEGILHCYVLGQGRGVIEAENDTPTSGFALRLSKIEMVEGPQLSVTRNAPPGRHGKPLSILHLASTIPKMLGWIAKRLARAFRTPDNR